LKPAIEDVLASWEFSVALPSPSGVPEFAPVRTTYLDLKKLSGAIQKAQRRLLRWRNATLEWIGEAPNKDALIRELKGSVETARAAGLSGGVETKRLRQLIDELQGSEFITALKDAARLGEDAPRGTVLTILGRGYEPVVTLCEELRLRHEEFMQSVEAELRSHEMKYTEDPVAEAKANVAAALSKLATLLEEFHENDAARPMPNTARANREA
jgi:hypothetical protein